MRKYCVIGSPVGHSKSPGLFERFSSERGFVYGKDVEYLKNEIKNRDELANFVKELRAGIWSGCNVTMPWKTDMVTYLDELSETAKVTDSVNTVSAVNGYLYGDSTDGSGMLNAVADAAGYNLRKDMLVILGCGGAARSIIAEAIQRRYKKVIIVCRGVKKMPEVSAGIKITEASGNVLPKKKSNLELTYEMLERMGVNARLYPEESKGSESVVSFLDSSDRDSLSKALSEAEILINSTPLGMLDGNGNENRLPLPEDMCPDKNLIVADCVYNPDVTLLIKKAEEAGCKTVKGIRMLEEQAKCGVELLLNGIHN